MRRCSLADAEFRGQCIAPDRVAGVVLGCKRAPDSPNFDRLLCSYSSPKAAYDIMHEPDAMSLGGHGSSPGYLYPSEHQDLLAHVDVHQLIIGF